MVALLFELPEVTFVLQSNTIRVHLFNASTQSFEQACFDGDPCINLGASLVVYSQLYTHILLCCDRITQETC